MESSPTNINLRLENKALKLSYESALEEVKKLKEQMITARKLDPKKVELMKEVIVKVLEENTERSEQEEQDSNSAVKGQFEKLKSKIVDITFDHDLSEEEQVALDEAMVPPQLNNNSVETEGDDFVHRSQFHSIAEELVLLFNRYDIIDM